MKQVAATPIAFVRAMVLAYEKYGKDPGAALRQAQITPKLLCLPNGRITASQMETISGLAMQELDDEALGWFSRRLPWGSYGMLCRASLTSPTFGRLAGGRTQPFGAHSLPAAPRGRHIAPGPKG
jgi:AraC-type transcriptional regulator